MAKHSREDGKPATGILAALLKARQDRKAAQAQTGWPLGIRRNKPHSDSGWFPSRGH